MKKLLKISMMLMLIIPSMFFFACGDPKVVLLHGNGYKTEFLSGEDFSIGDLAVSVTLSNDSIKGISTDNLQLHENTSILQNEEISINFSSYNKSQDGEYNIVITYLKDTSIVFEYKVNVVTKQFTTEDYQVQNYEGIYDGKPHGINVIQNLGANVTYGLESGVYEQSMPTFINVGTYTVYFKIEKSGYEPPVEGQGTVVINKAPLSIKVLDKTIKYNESFDFEYEFTGFVNGETQDVLEGAIQIDTQYQQGSNVGEYDVAISGYSSNNYDISYIDGKVKIDKAENNLIVNIPNTTYGQELQPEEYNESNGVLLYEYLVDETYWKKGLPVSAGEYKIRITSQGTDNYHSKQLILEELVKISKKDLIITPKTVEIGYNEEFQDMGISGITCQGFAYNDNETNLLGEIKYITDYKTGDLPKTYEVTVEGLTSDNYNITFNVGELIVNKALNTLEVSANSVEYGNKLECNITNQNSEAPILIEYKGQNATEFTQEEPKNAGKYTIKVTQQENEIYNSFEKIIEAEITQKVVEIEWGETTFTYDGQPHLPSAIAINLIQDDNCQIFVTGEKIQANENGYIAVAESLSNPNYCLPQENQKLFVINKIVVEVPSIQNVGTTPYNGQVQKSNIQDTTLYEVYENKGGIEAGIYPVKFRLIDGINYKWVSTEENIVSVNFEITKVNDNEILKCSIENIAYGQDPKAPVCEAKYGEIIVDYKLSKQQDLYYTSQFPVNAGEYTARFRVMETNSYNFCSKTCTFTITKVNPNYIPIETITANVGVNLYSIQFPNDPNGTWQWSANDYIFDEVRQIEELINFIPNDTSNYEIVWGVSIVINVEDNTLLNFDSADIIVKDVEVNVGNENEEESPDHSGSINVYYGIDIELKNDAEDAKIYYCETLTGIYSEYRLEYCDIGVYTIYVKIEKEGYNPYYTNATLTIKDYIIELFCYDKFAVMQGENLDISKATIKAKYLSYTMETYLGSDFEVLNFDSNQIGEQSITLSKDGRIFENALTVYVYEPFVRAFTFDTYDNSNNSVVLQTNKISNKTFSINFDCINNFYFESFNLIGGENIEVSVNQTFNSKELLYLVDEGTRNIEIEIEVKISVYSDYYKLIINYNLNSFKFKINEIASFYNIEKDIYTFNNVTAQTYEALSIENGIITGLYLAETQDFDNQENNLLSKYDISQLYFEDYPQLIVEVQTNFVIYREKLSINAIQRPLKVINVNELSYEIKDTYQEFTFEVLIGQELNLQIDELENFYVTVINKSNKIWLDETSQPITLILEPIEEETRYYVVVKDSKESNNNLQTIVIHLLKENFINSFIIQTENNSYDLEAQNNTTIDELIKGIQVKLKDSYTYELYINNILCTNILEDYLLNYGNNNIVLKIKDSKDNVVSYGYYQINYIPNILTLRYSYEETELSNYRSLSIDRDRPIKIKYSTIYFNYDNNLSNIEISTIIKINNIQRELLTAVQLNMEMNTLNMTIFVEGYANLNWTLHIYVYDIHKFTDNISNEDEQYQYGVYYDEKMLSESITETNILMNTDINKLELEKFTFKNKDNEYLIPQTIELYEKCVCVKFMYGETPVITFIKLQQANVFIDDNVETEIYVKTNDKQIKKYEFDESNVLNLQLSNNELIVPILSNKNQSIFVENMEYYNNIIHVIGEAGNTYPITIKIVASNNVDQAIYTINVTLLEQQ